MENKKIALGAWAWGEGESKDSVFGNNTTTETLRPVFEFAMENGFNLWDTALVYGMGTSEKILGEFLKKYKKEEYIISTKFTPQIAGLYGNDMQEMLNESKKNLNSDVIDIYWIHNPVGMKNWASKIIPLAKSNQIKKIGVSNHNLEEIKYVQSILNQEGLKLSAVQNHYSLLNRSSEEAGIIDYCLKNDMEFYSYMVLEQGALSGNYNSKNPFNENSDRGRTYNPVLKDIDPLLSKMEEIGKKYQANVAQIAIAWATFKNTVPIIGVTKKRHVEDLIHARTINLTLSEVTELEEIAKKIEINLVRSWEKSMK